MDPELGKGLRSVGSGNRLHSKRGAAAEWNANSWQLGVWGSEQQWDAQIESGGARITEGESTSPELDLARADALGVRSGGVFAGCVQRHIAVQAAVVHQDYAEPVETDFGPRENASTISGLAARVAAERMTFVGEIASDDGRGQAANAALSIGDDRIRATGYTSFYNDQFFNPGGVAWGGFAAAPGNQMRTGTRFMVQAPYGRLSLHAYVQRNNVTTDDGNLGHPRAFTEVNHEMPLGSRTTLVSLVSRAQREEFADGRAHEVALDRLRVTLDERGEIPLRIRAEWRTAAESIRRDHKSGSYLAVTVTPQVARYSFTAQATGFSFEDELVATSIYEHTIGDEFPLISLTGTGARGMLAVARNFGALRTALKAAYQHRDLRGDVARELEFAVAVTYRQATTR
jgi:hypothetical protein